MLEGNSTLEILCRGCNPLSHGHGFDVFADSMAYNQWILRLELDYCELETFQVKELFGMLEGHHSLEHLYLDGNLIDAHIAESFGELLRSNMSFVVFLCQPITWHGVTSKRTAWQWYPMRANCDLYFGATCTCIKDAPCERWKAKEFGTTSEHTSGCRWRLLVAGCGGRWSNE